jgi:23S rRNA pseudouridine2605 synthase
VVGRALAQRVRGNHKIGATLSSTQEFSEEQLGAARAKAWHQDGAALLTMEAAKDWINERGLVLFAPRTAQLPAPAPSLVEATLGVAKAWPTLADTEAARGFVARLVGEGLALPLNLLGVPGDNPDFVVSAQVFSFVFTMRGDKAWKLPPSTTGPVKVAPLGLKVYEALTERGAMTAVELAAELGREVTEAAILRSLTELWGQLRVIPLLGLGDAPTLWELTTRRFTKAIKAGANAGQPTALSALVSLYLGQVFGATEEEVATYLSPLTARSRVREVLHALMGARQLETVVVEGKTLLHVPGMLPEFGAGAVASEDGDVVEVPAVVEKPKKVGTGRIGKFKSEEKVADEFRGKPVRSVAAGKKFAPRKSAFGGKAAGGKTFGAKSYGAKAAGAKVWGARLDGKSEGERRPFKKAEKPTFSKPWNEEKKERPVKAAGATIADGFSKFRRPEPEDRAPLAPREQAGLPVEKRTPPKASFDRAKRPYVAREGGTRPFVKKPYTARTVEGAGERATFKPRSYEKKPGGFGAKAGGFGAKTPYTPRTTADGDRPYVKKPYAARAAEGGGFKPRTFDGASKPGFGAKRAYTPRTAEGGDRPAFAKKPYAPRAASDGAKSFAKRPYAPRAREGGERPYAKRTVTPRAVEDSGERTLPKRPYKPRAADADKRVFTKAPWTPAEDGAAARPRKSFGAKSGGRPGGFGGKKPGGFGPKKFGAKPFVRKPKPGVEG